MKTSYSLAQAVVLGVCAASGIWSMLFYGLPEALLRWQFAACLSFPLVLVSEKEGKRWSGWLYSGAASWLLVIYFANVHR